MQEARNRARALTRTLSDWLQQAKSRSLPLGWVVRRVMSKSVHWVGPEATARDAAKIMWEHDCGCVPVVDDQHRLLGVLTDRDLCMAAYTQGQGLDGVSVGSAMSTDVVACAPDDTLEQVVQLMSERAVRRVPVVDATGMLVGMVSVADVARACEVSSAEGGPALQRLGYLLAAISRKREPDKTAVASS